MNYEEAINELEKCIEEVKPKCFSRNGYSGKEQDEAVHRVSVLSGIIGRLNFERDKEKWLKDNRSR